MDQIEFKKKSRNPLYLFLFFVGIFIIYFIYIKCTSYGSGDAAKELKDCNSMADVKKCRDKYVNLSEDKEFIDEVRNKLESLKLSDDDIEKCKKWLPLPPTSINLILVPDLSLRIADITNNPAQIENDITLLNSIWENFVSQVRLKIDSKDRLILDVTDAGQVGGSFRTLADSLIFDLSKHRNKSNRLYFNSVGNRFSRNISKLYSLASKNPLGADYHYYFEQRLPKWIKKPTLRENYRNILLIITDGYLEAQDSKQTGIWAYTGTFSERTFISNQIRSGTPINDAIALSGLKPISNCATHFPNLEVLVVEVNPRTRCSPQEKTDGGTVSDFIIMKYQWTEWFKRLGIKNAGMEFFQRRNDATKITEERINEFLSKNTF